MTDDTPLSGPVVGTIPAHHKRRPALTGPALEHLTTDDAARTVVDTQHAAVVDAPSQFGIGTHDATPTTTGTDVRR